MIEVSNVLSISFVNSCRFTETGAGISHATGTDIGTVGERSSRRSQQCRQQGQGSRGGCLLRSALRHTVRAATRCQGQFP